MATYHRLMFFAFWSFVAEECWRGMQEAVIRDFRITDAVNNPKFWDSSARCEG